MKKEELYNSGEEVVETDRLIMRRLRPDDYLAMAAWNMDERVFKYLMGSVCKTPEEPLVWLHSDDKHQTSFNFYGKGLDEHPHNIYIQVQVCGVSPQNLMCLYPMMLLV